MYICVVFIIISSSPWCARVLIYLSHPGFTLDLPLHNFFSPVILKRLGAHNAAVVGPCLAIRLEVCLEIV